MDCSPPDSFDHGILQARILEWVAISYSRGSSQPSDWTWVSCIAGGFLPWNHWGSQPLSSPLKWMRAAWINRDEPKMLYQVEGKRTAKGFEWYDHLYGNSVGHTWRWHIVEHTVTWQEVASEPGERGRTGWSFYSKLISLKNTAEQIWERWTFVQSGWWYMGVWYRLNQAQFNLECVLTAKLLWGCFGERWVECTPCPRL